MKPNAYIKAWRAITPNFKTAYKFEMTDNYVGTCSKKHNTLTKKRTMNQ